MDWKREKINFLLLGKLFKKFSFSIGFWSMTDGIVRRLKLNKIYPKTNSIRYGLCKKYLLLNYEDIIEKYLYLERKNMFETKKTIGDDAPIWVFWYQGIEQLPYPINLTIESIKRHAGTHPVIVLDKNNYQKYVNLSSIILEKFNEGKGSISFAHFADILRIELLYKHGGIWMDSTFFMTRDMPKSVALSSFYTLNQNSLREWVISKDKWSVGYLGSYKNSSFISFCRDFLNAYFEREDYVLCYLMLDCIIAIGYEYISTFRNMIDNVEVNNLYAFATCNGKGKQIILQDEFERMQNDTYIYQLSYKQDYKEEVEGKTTLFGKIIKGG